MTTLQSIGRSNYRHYASAISKVSQSSEKLAKGEKLASFGGASDISIANRIDSEARADAMLLPTIQDGMGMVALQENMVSQFSDILSRMYELAASSQDTGKSTSDLMALSQEFSSLVTVINGMAANAIWETLAPLSDTPIDQVIGINSSGLAITQNIAMFASYGATQLVASLAGLNTQSAPSGLAVINNLIASPTVSCSAGTIVSQMTAQVGANMRAMENAYSNQQAIINAKENTQEAIREIDPVKEVAIFTTESVRLNTAQIIQTQANDLIGTLNRFLQSM